ncbi:MAG TPA: dihydrodipicolinate synthase family protein [Acidimicrobiales bacterium]|nr:dihydrodipicolinate synthase family protein [Acidimicrobiales bacterium]
MRTTHFHGVYPYLVTPLTEGGKLDEDAVERQVRRCITAGVHGLTPLGSSGELPLVPQRVRDDMVRAVVDIARGVVPVFAGVGAFDVRTGVEAAESAEDAGADGIVAVLFSYFPLIGPEAVAYFSAIARAVTLPVVIYYHPQFCGFELSSADATALAETENIRFVKDASGQIANIPKWRAATGDAIGVFASTSFSPTAAMLLGAVGWMSGPATVLPAASAAIYRLCREQRWAEAVTLERIVEPLLGAFRKHGPARTVKACLRVQGLDAGAAIAPLADLSPTELAELGAVCRSVTSQLEAAGVVEPPV